MAQRGLIREATKTLIFAAMPFGNSFAMKKVDGSRGKTGKRKNR